MTSELPAPLWDFKPIYDLLDAFKQSYVDHSCERPAQSFDSKGHVPTSLGDFDRIFEFLGRLITPPSDPLETSGSSDSSSHFSKRSQQSTPPSSLLGDAIHYDDFVDRKVRWRDEVHGSDLAQVRRRSRTSENSTLRPHDEDSETQSDRRSPRRKRRSRKSKEGSGPSIQTSNDIKNTADFESEAEPEVFVGASRPTLVPSWVTGAQPKLWTPDGIPRLNVDPMIIQPLDTLTFEEKRAKLVKKIERKFGEMGPLPLSHTVGYNDGIHIFVDCSNVIIGFYNALKVKRGHHVKAYTRKPPVSWQALATILERGRAVARRVLVGSNGSPLHAQNTKVPGYMPEAQKCGYELNILDRVLKSKIATPEKKKRGGSGYATTSGQSSGSDGTFMTPKVVAEQGVDEILQMKFLESLVDTHIPSTIVLASGDAAEAEYSGGFLMCVERALIKGWKVELVAWSAGLSQEYRAQGFLKKWKDKFTIIELDDFSEELLALYSYRIPPPW